MSETKLCEHCGKKIHRSKEATDRNWHDRTYCDDICSHRAYRHSEKGKKVRGVSPMDKFLYPGLAK